GNKNIPDVEKLAAGLAPISEMTDENGLIHQLWAVTDPAVVAQIVNGFADTKLYIADGHHRYETALNYRNYCRENAVADSGDGIAAGGSDYVMMMLVEMSHPGLAVFPTHRLLRELADFDSAAVIAACTADFDCDTVAIEDAKQALDNAYMAGDKSVVFYTGGETATLMTLRDRAVMDAILPEGSPASRGLDVNVLHLLVLERLLGIDKANMANQTNLTYTRSWDQAVAGVAAGRFQCCFLMNPTRVSEIRDVAAAGEKMPQKSTYFYPKLITGLTMNWLR
ncbi:MAG: DUF1015 domain-containing protein, partial [Oscillospiraceae bacterium]|nr:DUF1015 domain-containing protein [Oscillospiraceae bacterium]